MSDKPARIARKNGCWGLHFDFHAKLEDSGVGRSLTREMIEAVIDKAHPDYVQCDCKGHPGIASYLTEIGVPAGGFVADPLRLWREATAAKGIALIVHYSGVWDFEMVKRHPDWAAVDAEGKASEESTSTFGPYADQRMIPQLLEIRDKYEADGVWIDGDCWGVVHDYSDSAVAAFREAFDYAGPMPRSPGDCLFREWSEFNREGFRAYLRKVAAALHRHRPGFQIASNWAFSSFMPEPVSADVDFLSGDLSPQDGVNAARFEARAMAQQGMNWDLMSWSFNKEPGKPLYSTKSPVQLMQEAAVVISQGGGFQLYLKQRRDASVHMWPMDIAAEVGRFCREREPWCRDAERIPQIGLLLSRYALYRAGDRIFGPWKELLHGIQGALRALLESGYAVDILMEHMLEEQLRAFPLMVVPEWSELDRACKERLLAYAGSGGKLLLIGGKSAALFADELGIGALEPSAEGIHWLRHDGRMAGLQTPVVSAVMKGNCINFGELYRENDPLGATRPAASLIPYGAGTVGCVWFDFGVPYMTKRTSVQRDFLDGLVRRLFPEPVAELRGAHYHAVDVVCARKDGKLLVHLVNTSGPHADPHVSVYDRLQPVGPLQIVLRGLQRPVRVRLEPDGRDVSFEYESGKVIISGITVAVHEILAVE